MFRTGGPDDESGRVASDRSPDEAETVRADESGGLSIRNLRKTYADGDVVAVDGVSLDVDPGEFVVLLGPSGCGKTTVLRCIAGLEDPDAGRVFADGREITDRKPRDRDLAFVFQSIALFPHMTVRENVRFGLDMKTDLPADERNRRVRDAADVLGIADLLDRKPSALSGGQQQRVSLGRAMVMEPVAFLLDEPFSALDANLRDQMRVEVKKLHRRLGTAMVFVTHDQEEAMSLGDTIVVLRDGRAQQIDAPHDVYADPANAFVAEFVGSPSTNMIECRVAARDDGVHLVSDAVDLRVPPRRADALAARDGDAVVLGVRPEHVHLVDDGEIPARVNFVESQGPRDDVYLDADGLELRATTAAGETTDGATVGVEFDAAESWVFDADGDRVV